MAPLGWRQVLHDTFRGTELSGLNWRVRYSGGDQRLLWDRSCIIVNNGLTLQLRRDASGVWHAGGFQQGNDVAGGPSYNDVQVTVKCRFDRGLGLGGYACAWPYNSAVRRPEFCLVQTPGRDKKVEMPAWRWDSGDGVSASYPLDLLQWQTVTARRSRGRWNFWINGVEQVVPVDWAAHPSVEPLVFGVGMFVASAADAWYGGAPDATSPAVYNAHYEYVRISAP